MLQPPRPAAGLRCREIRDSDVDGIIDLLTRGFVVRRRTYWVRALDRLRQHPTPPGLPKFGYLLEHADTPVGVLLLIFSSVPIGTAASLRCNLSSWYVEPAFRSLASMLVTRALRHRDVTFTNSSPAPHTRATIEAQGFSRYCDGQFLAFPLLSSGSRGISVKTIGSIERPDEESSAAEFDLLKAHADLGCICLWCTLGGHCYPFAFLPRRIGRGLVPVAQLVYCRDQRDFTRCAGPIGRHLARRGSLLVLTDACGAIRGLTGKYFPGHGPKYFRGGEPPRLGDLAFTESVLFGP